MRCWICRRTRCIVCIGIPLSRRPVEHVIARLAIGKKRFNAPSQFRISLREERLSSFPMNLQRRMIQSL